MRPQAQMSDRTVRPIGNFKIVETEKRPGDVVMTSRGFVLVGRLSALSTQEGAE